MPQLLCLHSQLQWLGSVCPLTVVYDDSGRGRPAPEALAVLKERLGEKHLMSSSWLLAQGNYTQFAAAKGRQSLPDLAPGRRLFADAWFYLQGPMMIKLHLFGMPQTLYSRLVFLDLDLLIVRNIDHLLTMPMSHDLAAVGTTGCPLFSWPVFNGGVLVIKPSLEVSSPFAMSRLLYARCVAFGLRLSIPWPCLC